MARAALMSSLVPVRVRVALPLPPLNTVAPLRLPMVTAPFCTVSLTVRLAWSISATDTPVTLPLAPSTMLGAAPDSALTGASLAPLMVTVSVAVAVALAASRTV